MDESIIKMSVVIPTHGRVDLFKDTLHSLYLQTCKDFEVIISDDSPVEEDREKIKNIIASYQKEGMIIKYIFTKVNLLQAPNTNQGLNIAKGLYIRILHSDDLIAPECIKQEINAFENYPEIDLLYHNNLFFEDYLDFSVYKKEIMLNFHKPKDWLNGSIFTDTILPSCMCFRRSLLSEVGGMDENYKFLCDWRLFFDFLLNSYDKNKTLCCFSAGYVGWRMHDQSVTSTLFIDHFLEHENFINRIILIYQQKKLISKRKLKQNIYNATKYRYNRLLRDLKTYNKNSTKFVTLLCYMQFLLSRKYGIIHILLKIMFIPSQLISTIFNALYKIIFKPKDCIEKIEKKLVFLWK